ncbi:MAG: hypothetical protein OSJ66_08810 [Clostridia bacterium]|nr:hypothetical protein [Clostridia bacterium]
MEKLIRFLCNAVFCIAVALGMPRIAKAEVVINVTNFPDEIFREYITSNFDNDKNGELSEEEIAKATSINVNGKGITNLKGVEYFTVLEALLCDHNQLTDLNISKNTVLKLLDCDYNQLTTLDISKNSVLYDLDCDYNQLTTLDISKNLDLQYLYCRNNQLTTLHIGQNPALQYLFCGNNQLTILDIEKKSVNLEYLDCDNNQLTVLNIKNTSLQHLSCDNNNLTKLDVSKNIALTYLCCENNNLTELDLSQNNVLEYFYCSNNNLTKLDLSQNNALARLYCRNTPITILKLNKLSYNKLELEKSYLHGENSTLSNLSNVTENNGIIMVTDITKTGTYQYSNPNLNNGTLINFNILYVNAENEKDNSIVPHCTRIFNDYEYKKPVSGTAITLYGNCRKNTDTIKKDMILYTDILASYNYSVDNKGKIKASTGKVIAGITMSDTKPTITKNKIVDNEAAKIAKAKIKNGQITITATGKAGGIVYLWVMDTGNKKVSECCPINVKLAPKKLEVQETTGNKANKLKIPNESSKEIKIAGFVGTTKTEDCTYTATIDSKSQNYVSVTTLDNKIFTLKGTGLKNDKDTLIFYKIV